MPVEVIMPKVDMDMTSGKLAVWHIEEGSAVAKGAPLFDIETDKAAMEVESPATGRLHHILAQPGQTIDVGAPVAWIYAEGEALGERPDAVPSAPEAAPGPVTPEPAAAKAAALPAYGSPGQPQLAVATLTMTNEASDLRATPAARRLARENGLDLETVTGSGPKGRVQGHDVAEALRARAPSVSPAPVALRGPEPRTVPEAAPAVSWTAEAGDLHVTTRKGTGTPLLLIHGFAADSTGWAPFERELPRDLPLIRIDLPRHGRSPRQKVTGFPDLLRSVTRVVDRLDLGPVHLLGHSLGGAVALGLADIRPRQVASLALLASAGLGPEIDGEALLGIARASRAESLAPWLKRLTATPDGISYDFARAAMLARTDPELRAAQLDLADALFPDGVQSFDLHAALARVEAPTAIVWGREDKVIPWRHALAAEGHMALHLLKGVGHIPHVECPSLLAQIIRRHVGHAAGS